MNRVRKAMAVATVLAAATALGAGTAGTARAGGVTTNGSFCGRSYEDISHAQYVINPGTFGASLCMKHVGPDQDRAAGFTVTSYTGHNRGVNAFTEIFAGYQWQRHPVRSFEPVRASASGRPHLSVAWTRQPGHAHTGIDLWFNKENPRDPYRLGQNDGAEIMVWFNGNRTWLAPHIRLDGGRYNLTWWWTFHHGVRWPLVIFSYAGGPRHFFNGDLRPFMAYAARHTPMRMSMWLTSVGFGAELFSDSRPRGFTVRYFSLTGISTAGRQAASATVTRTATARYVARKGTVTATGVSVMKRSASATATELGHSADWRALLTRARATARARAAATATARALAAAKADAKTRALAILKQKLDPHIPKVTGMPLTVALRKLRAAGYPANAPRPVPGRVLHVSRTSPSAGAKLAQGKTVTVYAR